jgi:dienelactone hydrolase
MKKFVAMFVGTIFVVMAFGIASAYAKIVGKTVEYKANGTVMKGYLAYNDKIEGKRPGVLVVHEWWGLNDYTRRRARMLAELGYTALALDMYGEGKQATHPDDAGKFSMELMKNFDVAKARFIAGEDFLKKQPTVDSDRVAAISYCFGGGWLEHGAARSGPEGVVSSTASWRRLNRRSRERSRRRSWCFTAATTNSPRLNRSKRSRTR